MENRGLFADGAKIADRRLDVGQRLVDIVPHHGAVGEDRPQILQVAMFDGVEQALARRHLVCFAVRHDPASLSTFVMMRCFARPAMRPGSGASAAFRWRCAARRSEEHTSELQSLMRISYAVFCLKKKKQQ